MTTDDLKRERKLAEKKRYYYRHRRRILAKLKLNYAAIPLEERKAKRRDEYHRNHADKLARARQRYAENPERFKTKQRKYRAARLEEYRTRDRQYVKVYRDKDPERFRAKMRRGNLKRRALQVGAFMETVDSLVVFKRDGGRCGICHRSVDPESKWHIDHVIPLSKGGVHSYDNVQLAHARCNLSKQGKMPTGQLGLLQRAG